MILFLGTSTSALNLDAWRMCLQQPAWERKVHDIYIFHVLIHLTQNSDLQVRAVTDAPICYIGKPVHPDMICSEHPDGCGQSLMPGDTVMVNAGQCIYYLATQFVSVRIVNALWESAHARLVMSRSSLIWWNLLAIDLALSRVSREEQVMR